MLLAGSILGGSPLTIGCWRPGAGLRAQTGVVTVFAALPRRKTPARAPASRCCTGGQGSPRSCGFCGYCALAASGLPRPPRGEAQPRLLRYVPRFSLPAGGRSPAACAARLSANRKEEEHDLKLASHTLLLSTWPVPPAREAGESRLKSRVLGHCR